MYFLFWLVRVFIYFFVVEFCFYFCCCIFNFFLISPRNDDNTTTLSTLFFIYYIYIFCCFFLSILHFFVLSKNLQLNNYFILNIFVRYISLFLFLINIFWNYSFYPIWLCKSIFCLQYRRRLWDVLKQVQSWTSTLSRLTSTTTVVFEMTPKTRTIKVRWLLFKQHVPLR